MNDTAAQVFARLDAMGIPYEAVSHVPVNTIAESLDVDKQIQAVTVKNYFLCTRNKKRFFLCLVRPEARFTSGDISKQAGAPRLSFGPEDALEKLMHTYPGAVSPMGLMFDAENQVQLLVDSALLQLNRLAFHPCDNGMTLAMTAEDFFTRFLPGIHHDYQTVEIHDFLQ